MEFSELLGKTFLSMTGAHAESDRIEMVTNAGEMFVLYHSQDCCENVRIRQIDGDIRDLIGHPVTLAEESINTTDSTGIQYPDSFTWTFYKLATVKGYVTITWLGESNGYYSESVTFEKIQSPWNSPSMFNRPK